MVWKRLIGSDTTNSSGVASVTYTGKGYGFIDVVARVSSDLTGLCSDEKEILDCIFVGEGKTTGWLDGTSTTVTHITLEDGIVKWTVPASSVYLGYRNNSASGLIGQTIKTTVNLTSTRNVRLSTFAYVNGSWSSALSTIVINSNTETDTNLTFTVPTNTTQIWVRLQSNTSSDQLAQGDVVYVNKFEIYPI